MKTKSILDRTFRYTPSAQSTPERLRAKFQRIIREQQQDKGKVSHIQERRMK